MDYSSCLRADDYFVGPCPIDQARRMIVQHHYAGGASNTAISIHGLYRNDYWLAGVTWWLPPILNAAKSVWDDPGRVLSLSRMVILPDVPKNAATFLLSRSVKLLDSRWECLLTYADTWKDHDGSIYRLMGWEYLGLTKPERVYSINGRMTSRKAGNRTRTHAQMVALGAELIGSYPRHKFRKVRKIARKTAVAEQPSFNFGG